MPDINILSGEPDFAGPEPGVRKGKYKAAGKFKLILIFGLLSISIIILIIISHVELHNKTVLTVQLIGFMPYINFQPTFN